MRILFVVEHFPCLSETFVLNQVTGLIDLGHDVTVYAVGKPVAPVVHQDFCKYNLNERTWLGPDIPQSKLKRIIVMLRNLPLLLFRCGLKDLRLLNLIRYGKTALNLSLFYSALSLLNRDTKFDAIHCHFGDKGLLALALKEAGVISGPVSVVFHAHELAGLSDQEGMKLYGPLFRSKELLLPISRRWQERLIRWGANPELTCVHHMGVDIKQFKFESHAPKPDGVNRILSVGRFTEQKGYEYAIKAIACLKEKVTCQLEYVIIGSGELEVELHELVRDFDIEEIVTFLGPQTQGEVLEQIRHADLFFLPSVTASNGFQEGIPVALMEAMASGVPVVSTRHSGIPELIEHAVSGYLVEERQVEPLADAMAELIINRDIYQRCAEQGRAKIEREFNIETLNRQLSNILSGKFNHTD